MNESYLVRIAGFAVVFTVLTLLERIFPDRDAPHRRIERWPGNLGLIALGNVSARILGPLLPFAVALVREEGDAGLFDLIGLHALPAALAGIILPDFAVWGQHLAFHRIAVLRSIHRTHHTDTHVDITTGLRFHPLEIVLSALFKSGLVFVLGIGPAAVMIFEVLLNASSMFSHANIMLPEWLDRILRLMIITPRMHRIHHSQLARERNSNYGFFLSLWDRLLGTYTASSALGDDSFPVGMPGRQDPEVNRLDRLIAEPFVRSGSPSSGEGEEQ